MHTFYRYFFLFLVAGSYSWAQTQTKLTDKDVDEIKSKAKNNIADLENLMNFISFNSASTTEVQNVIERSFTASSNSHLFFNRKVVIEDDLTPGFNKDNTKDLEVEKYLTTLDVYYEKTSDPTIHFNNIQVSNVKKKDYLYVKVLYESVFDGKYKKSSVKYTPKQRMAIIRADKIDYSWQTRIIGITYYDPFKPITSTENDVVVINTNPYADEKQPDLSYNKNEIKPERQTEQRPFNVGVKIGINSSVWVGTASAPYELQGRFGGVFGVYARYYGKKYNHIGFGMDLLYIGKGAKIYRNALVQPYTDDYNFSYIEVPLFVNIFILGKDGFKPYINLGYAPAFLISAKVTREETGESLDQKQYFNGYDGNVILGAGLDFKVSARNRMTLDFRFNVGTSNLLKADQYAFPQVEPDQISQGGFSISLGYAFGL